MKVDAEKSTLGALLILRSGVAEVAEIVSGQDWSVEAHRLIFAAMQRLAARGEALDLLTLKDECERAGVLDTVGGPAYIASLVDGVPRSANIDYYARVVAGQIE